MPLLLTAEELRVCVGLAEADATQDALLDTLERDALTRLRRDAGRYFGDPPGTETARTEYGMGFRETIFPCSHHSGAPLYQRSLCHPPAGAVTVEKRYSRRSAWDPMAPEDFEVRGRRVIFTGAGGLPGTGGEFRFAYPAGYTSGTIPLELSAGICGIVAALYPVRSGSAVQGARITKAEFPEQGVTYASSSASPAAAESTIQTITESLRLRHLK
jgi:hypothetical protein